jgi:hypothetical protein
MDVTAVILCVAFQNININNNNNNNNNDIMTTVKTNMYRMYSPGTKQTVTVNKYKMSKEIKPLCSWVTNVKLEIFT